MSLIKKHWDIITSYALLLLAVLTVLIGILDCRRGPPDPMCALAVLAIAFLPAIGSLIFGFVILARSFTPGISKWRLFWLTPHAIGIIIIAYIYLKM